MKNYKKRKEYGNKGKSYYHFCTDGLKTGKLFYTQAQFAFGMILIGLLTIKYDIKVYAFVLMPNHIHIILSGTGENCVKAFDYLRMKISARLREDGYLPIPDDYDFVLLDINNQNQMRGEIAYVLRNPLEKNYSTPVGYIWGSGWIYHSSIKDAVTGKRLVIPSRPWFASWQLCGHCTCLQTVSNSKGFRGGYGKGLRIVCQDCKDPERRD